MTTLELAPGYESTIREGEKTAAYWRFRDIRGSRLLLERLLAEADRLAAECDANMKVPGGWKKPVAIIPVYPVIPIEEPLKPIVNAKVHDIQRIVCAHFKITKRDMLGQSRTADVVHPRMIAVYLSKELTHHTFPQIGRFFGGRDHTTALHAYRKISRLCLTDPDVAFDVTHLIEKITGEQH